MNTRLAYRHPLPVRLFHWINAVCFVILLMSGLLIFNTWPRLYFGHVGNEYVTPVFEIAGKADTTRNLKDPESWVRLGPWVLPATGVLGEPIDDPFLGVVNYAVPSWMTIPSERMALGYARGWHFLVMWIFAANVLWYSLYLLAGRLRTRLLPSRAQLSPTAILRDLWHHLRLRRATDAEALEYNLLQKLAYLFVLVLLPLQVLSGMTMSPSALSLFPWLIDLFSGRQTARTVHFGGAFLLTLFVLVHIFQVFVAGFVNVLRSMVTGYFGIGQEKSHGSQ
jgi:thiosulfate reductase cytochrome b subunit